MATITKLKPGQVVYSIQSQRMGNTVLNRRACFTVQIAEVNIDQGWVLASWTGNTPTRYYADSIRKWKVRKPEPKRTIFGMPDY